MHLRCLLPNNTHNSPISNFTPIISPLLLIQDLKHINMKTEDLIPIEGSKDLKCHENAKKSKIGFGLFIVAIGGMLLANAIHPNLFHMKFVWPIVIILIGLKLIFKSKNHHHYCHNRGKC